MNKSETIVILGAGPGLGLAVARLYGRRGYNVALVARRREPLDALAAGLTAAGITAAGFPGDLSRAENVPAILAAIRGHFGRIDALYFGPVPPASDGFTPASRLDAATLRNLFELYVASFATAVNDVLPEMIGRREGAVLSGLGGTAAGGLPFRSGPGPAMAAARNYLQSLHGEVAGGGVRVAMVTISAIIQRSAAHRAIESGQVKLDLPPGVRFPEADPDELAKRLAEAAEAGQVEVTFPPQAAPLA